MYGYLGVATFSGKPLPIELKHVLDLAEVGDGNLESFFGNIYG
jgi:hypothetical protein